MGDVMFSWLQEAGLGQYYGNFQAMGVNASNLVNLNMQDYARVGITDLQDRKVRFPFVRSCLCVCVCMYV